MNKLIITASEIRKATASDNILRNILHWISYGWSEQCTSDLLRPYWQRRTELTIQDGCILWGLRVCIPPVLCKQVLRELHETHVGIVRMKSLARAHVWWPGMDKEIEQVVHECYVCAQLAPNALPAPLHSWEYLARPWQRVHVDFAGPFQNMNWFILIDAHSDYPIVVYQCIRLQPHSCSKSCTQL